jgi:hypothetical protein
MSDYEKAIKKMTKKQLLQELRIADHLCKANADDFYKADELYAKYYDKFVFWRAFGVTNSILLTTVIIIFLVVQ